MKNKAAQELGKLGGSVKSEAKAKASRKNGKLGGRPRKIKVKLCPMCSRELEQIVETETNAVLGLMCQTCGWQEKY